MLLEESVNAQSPGHGYPSWVSKGIATMSRMSTFSAGWTTIAAMLECHAERFGSRPAIPGEGGGCSFRSRKCTRRWQRCHLNCRCRCSSMADAVAAGARSDEPVASREIDLLETQERL